MRRKLKRLVLRKSFAGQKIGRDRTAVPSAELAQTIELITRHLGGSERWRRIFSQNLIRWVMDESDHATVTENLTREYLHGRWIPEQLYTASQLAAAVGLFEVAYRLELRGITLAQTMIKSSSFPLHQIEEIQTAIHTGDLCRATDAQERFKRNPFRARQLPFSTSDLLHYVDVWAKNSSAETLQLPSNGQVEFEWARTVHSRDVVVYGPGITPLRHKSFEDSQFIARIAGPGSHRWREPDDLAGGRTDAVYMTRATLNTIGPTSEDLEAKLGDVPFICISGESRNDLDYARKVEPGSRLFLRGHPNMVPLICIDLVRAKAGSIYVTGSDFFSSKISYRPDSRRITPAGVLQTTQGSNGNRFDRTTLMASHNVFQNRRLVRNLVEAERIQGDDNFLSACALSDVQYAKRLDFIYGQHKI